MNKKSTIIFGNRAFLFNVPKIAFYVNLLLRINAILLLK
jgi:hypothetical protein